MNNVLRVWVAVSIVASACGGRFSEATGAGDAGTGGAGGSGVDAGTGGGSSGGAPGTGGYSSTGGAGDGGAAGWFPMGGSGDGGAGGFGAGGGAVDGGSAGAPDWYACRTGECTIVSRDCCGLECEPVKLAAFDAVNYRYAADYVSARNAQCSMGAPLSCPDIGCLEPQPGQANRPNFVGLCQQGHCAAADIRTAELTACQSDSDCYLRWGSSCCEACGGLQSDLIALSTRGNFYERVCAGEGLGSCPPCVPQPYPEGVTAQCNAQTGHCQVASGNPVGPGMPSN